MLSDLKIRWWLLPLLGLYVLVFAEVFVRVLHPVLVAPRYVVAADYGVRANWPSISYRHFGPEYSVDFEINSKGVRSPREIEYSKPSSVFRVVALGDSFTMGYGANYEETFLAAMQRSLAAQMSCRVEVINLGVSGLGTAEQLLLFRSEAVKYEPDAVVLQWHESDLRENVASGLYGLGGAGLVPKRTKYLPQVATREWLFSFAVYRFVADHSMAYTRLRNKVSKYVRKFNFSKNAATVVKRNEAQEAQESSARPGLLSVAAPAPPAGDVASRLAVAVMKQLVASVEQEGAQAILLDVPKRRDRVTFASEMPEQLRSLPSVYSPIDDFRDHRGEMLYWERSAGHFTPLGNRVVGEGLARRVKPDCGL